MAPAVRAEVGARDEAIERGVEVGRMLHAMPVHGRQPTPRDTMRLVRRVPPIAGLALLMALALGACGGGDEPPPGASVAPPPPATGANAVTVSPFDGEGITTGAEEEPASPTEAVFPAPDPQGLLALAALHPDGKVVYATLLDGARGELAIVRQGGVGVVEVTRETTTVRVGVRLDDASITWVCVTEGADEPRCRQRDVDDLGSSALATAALLVGEDRVRQIAARATEAADANLEVEARAGGVVDASCLTGTSAGVGDLRVCVSPSGFVTDTEEGPTSATAMEVNPDVDPLELQPTKAPT